MPKDHISREQFLLEFFGYIGGRDLGNPEQHFTDNPNDVILFIEENAKNKLPSFMSIQPRVAHDEMIGIERIFFDFDYGKKNENLTEKKIAKRKQILEEEVKVLIRNLKIAKVTPLVLKTRRGYHFHIYFDTIYRLDKNLDLDFWKRVYKELQRKFMVGRQEWITLDRDLLGNIKGLCRIPLSIHEKSGEEIKVLDTNLKPDKLRSIDYYRLAGLKVEDIHNAMENVQYQLTNQKKRQSEIHEVEKENWKMFHGYIGEIRLCFQARMEAGEMEHAQRRALLVEAYYAGYNTEEKMLELFRCFHDFDGDKPNSICRYQIHYWFEHEKPRPYECDTIQEHGWCLGEKCSIYRQRMEKLKNGIKRT